MWHPSSSTANFIYETSSLLLFVGILTTGIAAAGIWWMGPIRDAYFKADAAQSGAEPSERAGNSHFEAGKQKLARLMAQRSRPPHLSEEQIHLLSSSFGDHIRELLIIRAADIHAAIIVRQLVEAFEKAKIRTRVGVIDAAPAGLMLYDPDELRGGTITARFEQAHIDIGWEKRLHPRFPGQPVLLVGRSNQPADQPNLPAGEQRFQ
jgi:hypothetical protein